MKYFILLLIVLVGCSKADIKPSTALTGHWSFQSANVSGDFTILNTSNGYSLEAGGIFSINGVKYACDQFWIPQRSTGNIDIYLGSPMTNSSREAMLVFSIDPSSLQYSILQPVNIYYELNTDKKLVNVKDPFFLEKD
ncbi:MAG: hypothetical protein JJE09_08585 [Bacteroidia bacterium]|nr:hypothetical protein [Bacteroidia bacterium]